MKTLKVGQQVKVFGSIAHVTKPGHSITRVKILGEQNDKPVFNADIKETK